MRPIDIARLAGGQFDFCRHARKYPLLMLGIPGKQGRTAVSVLHECGQQTIVSPRDHKGVVGPHRGDDAACRPFVRVADLVQAGRELARQGIVTIFGMVADELDAHSDPIEHGEFLFFFLSPEIGVAQGEQRCRCSRYRKHGDRRRVGHQLAQAVEIEIPLLGPVPLAVVIRVYVSADLGVGHAGKAGAVMSAVVRYAGDILRRDQRCDSVVVADAGKINERDVAAQSAAQGARLVMDGNAQGAGLERALVFGEIPVGLVGNVDAYVTGAGDAR